MTPSRLIHLNYERSDNLLEIAQDAAAALHMGKGEHALLAYYAAQSSGFRPALMHIASITGLSRSQICKNKQALIVHGLAAEKDGCFYINWARAKIYASLDPSLTSKRSICAAFNMNRRIERMSLFEFNTLPTNRLIAKLARLPETEFAALCRRIRKSNETNNIKHNSVPGECDLRAS